MDTKERCEELSGMLEPYGIETNDAQLKLLLRHLELVVEKNREFNLTRIVDFHSGMILHVLDSLLLLPAVNRGPKGHFLDIGTGAGYPGIPLGIVSGRKGLLVDSVGKKVAAVEGFVGELGLSGILSCEHARVEDLARARRGGFAVVVARAVAQANVLVEYATPLLAPGGHLVLAKGRLSDDELAAGDAAAKICGLQRVSRETRELPEDMGHREIISFEKVARPRVHLPRKAGDAKRHPLGI